MGDHLLIKRGRHRDKVRTKPAFLASTAAQATNLQSIPLRTWDRLTVGSKGWGLESPDLVRVQLPSLVQRDPRTGQLPTVQVCCKGQARGQVHCRTLSCGDMLEGPGPLFWGHRVALDYLLPRSGPHGTTKKETEKRRN
jgi:hypothetical protein